MAAPHHLRHVGGEKATQRRPFFGSPTRAEQTALCPGRSDGNLLGDGKRVVELDAARAGQRQNKVSHFGSQKRGGEAGKIIVENQSAEKMLVPRAE